MPMFDDEVDQIVELELSLMQLAEKFGPIQIQQALYNQDLLPTYARSESEQKLVLLSDAVEHYLESDSFQSLAPSSKEVYKYEINMLVKYCKEKTGQDPNIKAVASALFLQEYLKPVKKDNTRSKKSAFLRSILRETLSHFFNQDINNLKKTLRVTTDKSRNVPRAFESQQIDELLSLARLGRESQRNFTILYGYFLGLVYA
ncbi:hypothetical protein J2T13_001032 [Paenibacillus sp. DS2015]|uniref:hypothetical protein n=1 Tax=Paenibacillus sp. DS2015 TaxID=3373917 RepID=UPI003D25C974